MLAQHQQNIEISNLSIDRQVTVGPTLAKHWQKSDDDVTNGQCWQNLPTMLPTANVGPMVECYLGSSRPQ